LGPLMTQNRQQPTASSIQNKSDAASPMPSINLPKGGGAVRGIGEKFGANAVTGTGSTSIPITTSPGRAGFGPQLSLSYDSGAGNGPFGLGWNLSLPAITRKTDKGLPRYADADDSDVFVLSGSEDLVPVYQTNADGSLKRNDQGKPIIHEDAQNGYTVRRYRPRIEGLFARIERWTHPNGETYWRSITRDNITTLYGKDNNSRIFDPADPDPVHPTRIFSWLICQSYDARGNAILYQYVAEDDTDVDPRNDRANERNRVRTANRYLKRILYGNRTPNRANDWTPTNAAALTLNNWMFETVFDYGDHDEAVPLPTASQNWTTRNDPFSMYRAGFEVRTYRLCQRVLMFHHFPQEANVGANCLVRSTDFAYSYEDDEEAITNPIFSKLLSVTQRGYQRIAGGYLPQSMPSVDFTYSEAEVQQEIHDIDPTSLQNLSMGLDGTLYQWTDLHGEGLPGILTEQAGAWFYKRNLSPLSENEQQAKFAPLEQVMSKPNLSLGGQAQFMDLAGDGQPDLVVMDGAMPGLYEHDDTEGWHAFRPFTERLNRDLSDGNLKFVDVDGDGHCRCADQPG
jgi:hypothetical protein